MKEMDLFGVRIHDVTVGEAVERALADHSPPCTVVTPNALMLGMAKRDASYKRLLNRATLSLPDGVGVLFAAKRAKTPLRERSAGIDFGFSLCRTAAQRGLRVFLLGARPSVAEKAAASLQKQIESLVICGTYHGYFDQSGSENERVLAAIRASRADVLFVCFGTPLQEEWVFSNLKELSALRVIACLGGSLDVWSGSVPRAPRPLRALGLEWAWRTLLSPRRLKSLPLMLRGIMRT